MVFFTCAHCGESLKKNKVEKHYQTVCSRNLVSLTCVDCCKDFSVETYPGHTKCITEEEKYSGKDFVPRPSANKGEKKQKKWQDVIQSVQEKQSGLSNEERTILNVLVKHENVPRKKNKFQNFLRNVMNNRFNSKAADSIFDKLEAAGKEGTENKEDIIAQENNEKQHESMQEDEKENANTSCVKENVDNPKEEVENEEKLSKKERKEKRKRAKYEAELREIESNQIPEEEEDNEDEGLKKKKKSKKGVIAEGSQNDAVEKEKKSKKKHKEAVETEENGIAGEEEKSKKKHKGTIETEENDNAEEEEKPKKKHKGTIETEENGIAGEEEKSKKKHKGTIETEENGIAGEEEKPKKKKNKAAVESTENISEDVEMAEGGKSKKHKKETEKSKKKRKMGYEEPEELCKEPANKKIKETETEEIAEDSTAPATGKFSWQDIIVQVLNSKDSKELSLKKLRKKVLAEFEAMGCGSASDTKIIAKFNKKVQKTPGVVVHKENAKLVLESQS
ncbi:cell growth-regulating nucleolar protein [Periplaneta americana]|uniref:cell growth-regulating nucleolar protein n=1 Tax=Periplaneta americana TaxID=6978 RepID=UPI0037E75B90